MPIKSAFHRATFISIKMKFFVATLFIGLALGAPQGSQKDYETVPYTVVATHHVGDQSVSCFMNS